MPKMLLYTVKEAADIVGVSTNTLYKYLLEGKIKAARGTHKQGRFRIPKSALEEFLGTTIPDANIATPSITPLPPSPITLPTPSANKSRKKLIRLLLLLALIALIIDTMINPNWTVSSGILRLFAFALLILIIYRPRRSR